MPSRSPYRARTRTAGIAPARGSKSSAARSVAGQAGSASRGHTVTARHGGPAPRLEPHAPLRYVVIGLGGVGSHVLRLLTQYLYSERHRIGIVAIDGDAFEERNRARMSFDRMGKKAGVLCDELAVRYGEVVSLRPVARYVTPHNVWRFIQDRDVVFCAPDNHKTRRVVERRCARLDDVALFSGGNDGVEDGQTGTYGNVQIYLRRGGCSLTNPLSRFHPEIAAANDLLPTEQGCGAMAASAPQLLFTNAAVATAMVSAFYAWRRGVLDYEELYLDIAVGRMNGVRRAPPARTARSRSISGRSMSARKR